MVPDVLEKRAGPKSGGENSTSKTQERAGETRPRGYEVGKSSKSVVSIYTQKWCASMEQLFSLYLKNYNDIIFYNWLQVVI